jgi:anti-sigma factor RsiW
MNRCEEIRVQALLYLDEELSGQERASIESHLAGCPNCREMIKEERRFLESVSGARPLYTASQELRARVEETLVDAPPPHVASKELRRRVQDSFGHLASNTTGLIKTHRALSRIAMAAMIVIAALIALWLVVDDEKSAPLNPPSEFALMAVDTHQRYLRGQLPLEIVTDAADKISAWFAGKVPFGMKLPNYQESSGQEKLYELEGARLVGFKKDYAAYVAYKMQMRSISLVVTSNSAAMPSGGEEITSRGLTFHYDTIDGYKVITWSDRGLTYALVSDLEERGQQSCVVCHQGTKDRDFIESLKP